MSNSFIPFARVNFSAAIGYDTEQINECAAISEAYHGKRASYEDVWGALVSLWASGKYKDDTARLCREEKLVCAIRGWNPVEVAGTLAFESSQNLA
jgi:hypothetical protein